MPKKPQNPDFSGANPSGADVENASFELPPAEQEMTETEPVEIVTESSVEEINAETVQMNESSAAKIVAQDLTMNQSGAAMIKAGTAAIQEGGAALIYGQDISLSSSSAAIVYAHNVQMTDTRSAITVAREIEGDGNRSFLLISGKVSGVVETAIDSRQAVLIGVIAGFTAGLLFLLQKLISCKRS